MNYAKFYLSSRRNIGPIASYATVLVTQLSAKTQSLEIRNRDRAKYITPKTNRKTSKTGGFYDELPKKPNRYLLNFVTTQRI